MAPEDRSIRRYRARPDTVATDRGDGPPLVLSHGTLMDRTMFDPQLSLADEYRVVAYDARARTDRYVGPYDLYDLADDCAALLDAKGVDSCVLGGMSMGGFVNYPAVNGGACRWTPAHASDEAGENSPFAFNVPDFRAS